MAPPSADVISGQHAGLPAQMQAADGKLKGQQLPPRPSAIPIRAAAPKVQLPSKEEATQIASSWLAAFQSSLDSQDIDSVLSHFHEDAYWKDLLTFEWDHHCKQGKPAIKAWLTEGDRLWKRKVHGITMETGSAVSLEAMPGLVWIMAFFDFETAISRGRGAIRLQQVPSSKEWKAYLFYMGIEELIGHEEKSGPTRPQGVDHGNNVGRESWLQRREKHLRYEDGHEPDVVVVGAGQGGLTVAARLGQLGVDTLIVERNPRVGDNWRNRYSFLVLHDPVWYDHLPYQNFPPHWPVFTPKDKLADWLESYAKNLEMNVWTSTKLGQATYDQGKKVWTVHVTRENGEERVLHPKFVILASGHSGEPNMPKFKGAENFKGQLVHSSQHTTGRNWQGKKAVVIGCCNSGHDISHDFAEQGADITIVQRSKTYIMSSESVVKKLFSQIYCEGGPPVEDCDLIFNSTPNPVHIEQMSYLTADIADFDKEILEGLQKAGFALAWGPKNAGFLPLYFSRGGGYYLDVGASKLIADGRIKVKQGQEIDHLDENGIIFADGSRLDADIIVCATGYQNMKTTALKIFGDEVKDTKEVWGMDEEGELKTMWRDSGHPGFFYMGGNLALCRFMSKRLALRIKAQLVGLA